MPNINFEDYVNKINSAKISTSTSSTRVGSSVCSFGVVYNKNGKRLSFSKGLATKLDLDDTVDIIPHSAEGVVHIGKNLEGLNGVSTCSLKGEKDESRISYAAGIAEIIANEYGLNFAAHSSYSFQSISFGTYKGNPVAVIRVSPDDAIKHSGESA